MIQKLRLKGFEVELFTGRSSGENVGVAELVKQDLTEFCVEPDHRNLEYITEPESDYGKLKEALLAPRRRLRTWLAERDLTLLPGSTLTLGDATRFERSNPNDPYHDLIEATYGTTVVTASIHINLGISEPADLFPALRLVRCEAALLLALSASSPFLNRQITGAHSQRWLQFPLTPKHVPLFRDLEHFVEWTDTQLVEGRMHNVRHLWTSVRPNGPQRPFDLNRLELRICDLVTNPDLLLAITALMELRVLMLLREPDQLDPLKASDLSADQLMVLSDRNDAAAARHSLDAQLHDWRDGRQRLCRDWLKDMINAVMPVAHELGLASCLSPLEVVLAEGNQAMRWLKGIESGRSLEEEFRTGILAMEQEEQPVDRFLADALG